MKVITKQLNKLNIFSAPLSLYEMVVIERLFYIQRYIVLFGWILYAKAIIVDDASSILVTFIWARNMMTMLIVGSIYKRFCIKMVLSVFGIIRNSYFMISILLTEIFVVLLNVLSEEFIISSVVRLLNLGGI